MSTSPSSASSSSPRPRIVFLDASTLSCKDDIDLTPLREIGALTLHDTTLPDEVVDHIGDGEIVLTNKVVINGETMAACPNLKFIQVVATGTNNVDLAAAKERGIPVSNVSGYSDPSVAQHVFAFILNLVTHVDKYSREPQAWARSPIFTRLDYPITELAGKRLGIAGLGAIGSTVATIAEAFGMEVVGLAREGSSGSAGGGGERPRLPKNEFFSGCDFISLHCPLTDETRQMINAETLGLMKPTAFLINTGRGDLVDESALAEALRSGSIAGAGLDVLSKEPPPADHPLLSPNQPLPNLLITPHTAWSSKEARARLFDGVIKNIEAYLKGEPTNCVA